MKQSLDLRQAQSLVMTPQMQQAVKLLQLSNLELADFLEEEIAQNPLLEKAEPAPSEDNVSENTASEDSPDQMEQAFDDVWENNGPQENEHSFSSDPYANIGKGGSSSFEGDDRGFDERISEEKSLRDHLLQQIGFEFEDHKERSLATLIMDRLDEQGYLREDLTTLAESLSAPVDLVEAVLNRLKTFDPSGLFARDLAECLALQLADQGKLDDVFQAILDRSDMLAKHDLQGLAKQVGITLAELQERLGVIRHLNPRPVAEFDHFVVQTAIPDVLMKKLPREVGGGWRVELNNDTLPRVLVNQSYYTDVLQKTKNKEDKEYLSNQMNAASWLVKALDQRAQTILKVAAAIIEAQDGFFLYGIEFLKPLTLREIAAEIDMHESTVSRVTTGKFIATPRGLFELKFFFSSSIQTADGSGAIAGEAVRARIKGLIDAESADDILSDDTLVELLRKDGIEIARRTVAKYREAMNIGSSVQRRRQKSI